MSLGKQAKVLNSKQVDALLHHVGRRRNGLRNQVMPGSFVEVRCST